MSDTTNKAVSYSATPEAEAILKTLGREEGTSGTAIVNALAAQAKRLDGMDKALHTIQQDLSNAVNNGASKETVEAIRSNLRLAANALMGASTAVQVAKDHKSEATNETVGAVSDHVDQAVIKTESVEKQLADIKADVVELKDHRKNVVDPHIKDTNLAVEGMQRLWEEYEPVLKRVKAEQGAPSVPSTPSPKPEPTMDPKPVTTAKTPPEAASATRTLSAVSNTSKNTTNIAVTHRHYDVRAWSAMTWLFAIVIGLFVGWFWIGAAVQDLTTPIMGGWSILWRILITIVAFFGGGWLGEHFEPRWKNRESYPKNA